MESRDGMQGSVELRKDQGFGWGWGSGEMGKGWRVYHMVRRLFS